MNSARIAVHRWSMAATKNAGCAASITAGSSTLQGKFWRRLQSAIRISAKTSDITPIPRARREASSGPIWGRSRTAAVPGFSVHEAAAAPSQRLSLQSELQLSPRAGGRPRYRASLFLHSTINQAPLDERRAAIAFDKHPQAFAREDDFGLQTVWRWNMADPNKSLFWVDPFHPALPHHHAERPHTAALRVACLGADRRRTSLGLLCALRSRWRHPILKNPSASPKRSATIKSTRTTNGDRAEIVKICTF